MLELTAERARIGLGQEVLDLGCGWGSFSLHAAAAWPDSRFLAVSNSRGQIDFIRRAARDRGLANLEARVADVNGFAPERRFDRIVSVEMMEHVRGHAELFGRIAGWLLPGGRVFVHVFCHRLHAYPFEARGAGDWMARRFFTGGVMPSEATIPRAAGPHFRLDERWRVSGTHYARTADAWLANLDARRGEAGAALAAGGEPDPDLALRRWRLFFLAVRETFGFAAGREWGVAHYLFEPRGDG
jgi:cyclopropane-fatty-acyl-phospholipid synthase